MHKVGKQWTFESKKFKIKWQMSPIYQNFPASVKLDLNSSQVSVNVLTGNVRC